MKGSGSFYHPYEGVGFVLSSIKMEAEPKNKYVKGPEEIFA